MGEKTIIEIAEQLAKGININDLREIPHPRYSAKGRIPAFDMIKDSINIHHGCFGGCSFCTISAHQGKFISSGIRYDLFLKNL